MVQTGFNPCVADDHTTSPLSVRPTAEHSAAVDATRRAGPGREWGVGSGPTARWYAGADVTRVKVMTSAARVTEVSRQPGSHCPVPLN